MVASSFRFLLFGTPGLARAPPGDPPGHHFGAPTSILEQKTIQKSSQDAPPNQGKRNPENNETFAKASEEGYQTNYMPLSFFDFFACVSSVCFGVSGSGVRVSGLLPLCQGWWGHAKRIEYHNFIIVISKYHRNIIIISS